MLDAKNDDVNMPIKQHKDRYMDAEEREREREREREKEKEREKDGVIHTKKQMQRELKRHRH